MQHEADFIINLKNREWFQTSGTIPDFSSAQPLLPYTPSAEDISSVNLMLHHVICEEGKCKPQDAPLSSIHKPLSDQAITVWCKFI